MPAVLVENLTMAYGAAEVLRGVDLEIGRGEVLALLGSNGAGKTTTVEILEGHRHRTGGSVRVLGTDPARGGRAFRDRIGIVLQSTAIDPDLRVIEAARAQARWHRDPLDPDEVLGLVGLTDDRRRKVGVLSGGRRRRLDLALAVIGRPELIFLDEPTTGFDPEARHLAWDLIDDLRTAGTTVLLTSHHTDEVARLADRVAVLRDGRIVADDTPHGLVGDITEITFRTTPQIHASLERRFPLTERDGRSVLGSHAPTRDLHRLTAVVLDHDWKIDDLAVGRPDLESTLLELLRGTD